MLTNDEIHDKQLEEKAFSSNWISIDENLARTEKGKEALHKIKINLRCKEEVLAGLD